MIKIRLVNIKIKEKNKATIFFSTGKKGSLLISGTSKKNTIAIGKKNITILDQA